MMGIAAHVCAAIARATEVDAAFVCYSQSVCIHFGKLFAVCVRACWYTYTDYKRLPIQHNHAAI